MGLHGQKLILTRCLLPAWHRDLCPEQDLLTHLDLLEDQVLVCQSQRQRDRHILRGPRHERLHFLDEILPGGELPNCLTHLEQNVELIMISKGDDLYFFGFSRGAYTARFLASMLDSVGLLAAGNEELQRFAW